MPRRQALCWAQYPCLCASLRLSSWHMVSCYLLLFYTLTSQVKRAGTQTQIFELPLITRWRRSVAGRARDGSVLHELLCSCAIFSSLSSFMLNMLQFILDISNYWLYQTLEKYPLNLMRKGQGWWTCTSNSQCIRYIELCPVPRHLSMILLTNVDHLSTKLWCVAIPLCTCRYKNMRCHCADWQVTQRVRVCRPPAAPFPCWYRLTD